MAQNTIDSLDIVISADTSKATKNVNALVKKLATLRNTFKALNNGNVAIGAVVRGLKDIAKIDFSGAEKSLEAFAEILKRLDAKKLEQVEKGMNAVNSSSTAKASASSNGLNNTSLLSSLTIEGKSIETAILNMNAINYEEVASKVQAFVNRTKKAVDDYGDKFIDVHNKALRTLQRVNKTITKKFDDEWQNGGENLPKDNPIANFFGRVVSRAIFSLVRLIIQAVKELIKELINQFAIHDEKFNEVISEAWSAIKFLKHSIMATFAPVVKLLAPIITMLGNVLSEVLNNVAEFTAMLAGQDYYYKATKSTEDFAESVDKANKAISLGIDELNVIQGNDEGFNFEKVAVSENTSSLKNIVKTLTHLDKIISAIAETLFVIPLSTAFDILSRIEPAILLISNILSTLLDVAGRVLQSIPAIVTGILTGDWSKMENIWKDIGSVNQEIWADFGKEWGESWNAIAKDVETIRDRLSNFKSTGLANLGGTSTGDKVWKNIVGVLTGGISYLFTGTGFATGGFPEDGLFYANHNELVGQFANGKTAVANNEQITQGIYQAVLQAMRESGSNGNGEIVINLDSYEIARVVTARQNNFGLDLVGGGVIKYGK